MTTLLVDGNNLLARADFAAKNRHVEMSANGVNTAALVLFVNMMSKYVRQVKPTHVGVCWDAGHDYRDSIYPEYKAARRKAPEGPVDDTQPFEQAKQFLALAGIKQDRVPGWEADDLIAVAVRQSLGQDVVILSGDKDLLQLVCVREDTAGTGISTKIIQIRPPDDEPWDEARVEQKFGVLPHHLSYYLALVGDPGDGVPGVRGLGPKKAVKALEEAEWDWEALLAGWEPERAAEARLMHDLVNLRTLEYPDWLMSMARTPGPAPTTGTWSTEALLVFCDQYGLKTIKDRLLDGTLWVEHPAPSTEGVFDNFDLGVETHRVEVLDPPLGPV